MSEPKFRAQRSAGVLVHPTSLPGPFGIGDLGPAAYAWVDSLIRARQKWWQILPLGPTGFGDSPYQSFSAFAGNPYLISPQVLVQEGLLRQEDIDGVFFPPGRVDFWPIIQFKIRLLNRASDNFQAGWAPQLRGEFETFLDQQKSWLDDYALFMAIKDAEGGRTWQEWPDEWRVRDAEALERTREELAQSITRHQFRQFLFFRQWNFLKKYANERGVRLIGDAPIFVAGDSADVWANPQFFLLNEDRRPRFVAGVPPDYFSATGQLWGNPLYDWPALKATGYAWWIARVKATLAQVDLVRLDHFRGFEAYWEIPAGMPTAEKGRWVPGPGGDLFQTLLRELGQLPFIAEDLGIITPEVEKLREMFHLPGMRVLQFAFGGATEHRFLPHNYDHNTVVYTGTHDNDTTVGWYAAITERERDHVRRYCGRDGTDIAGDLIRLAWASVADYALAPLQDVLAMGTESRMNLPGQSAGNWSWRFTEEDLTPAVLDRLAQVTELYGRS